MKATDFAAAANAVDMTQLVKQISQDVKEYLVIAEIEQTRRAEIKAASKVELAKIEAMRSTLEMFLDRSFEERRRNFEELFSVIKGSMKRGDLQTLESSLTAVVELARISPLAEARSLASLKSAMNDSDHEFVI